MLAIRGIYDGKRIESSEEIPFKGEMMGCFNFSQKLVDLPFSRFAKLPSAEM
jgi:hypothetical protein